MSYDQRGFGRSAGDPGKLPDELTLVTDAVLVFDLVRKERPAEPPPVLVAHSMGATIAAFAVARGLIAPRGLALSSPAIAPRISPFEEQILRGLVTFAPGFALDSRIMPEEVTRDKHEQKKIMNDPLMHRTVTPRLVLSLVDQGRITLASAGQITVPTLLLVAGSDLVVDPDETLRFFGRLPSNLSTLHQYPALFHEVFNELPAARKRVFADFDRWLRHQLKVSAVRRRAKPAPLAFRPRRDALRKGCKLMRRAFVTRSGDHFGRDRPCPDRDGRDARPHPDDRAGR